MRRLRVTRRLVALDCSDDYLAAWEAARAAVQATGANAWIFRGTQHQDQFLEFIEWSDDADPLDDETAAAAMAQLDAFAAPKQSDEWEEAT